MGTSTIDFSKYKEKPQIDFSKYEPVSGGKTEGVNLPPPEWIQEHYGRYGDTDPQQAVERYKNRNFFEKTMDFAQKIGVDPFVKHTEAAIDAAKQGEYARAGNEGFKAATPIALAAVPQSLALRPIATTVGIGTGLVGGKVAQSVAHAAGASPEQSELIGNIGGIATGVGAGKLSEMVGSKFLTPKQTQAIIDNIKPLLPREVTGRLPFGSRFEATKVPTLADYIKAVKKGYESAANESGPVPADSGPAPAPYRLSGNQITDAATVTPRRILGPERQLPAAPDTAPIKPSAAPETKLPNATYLRPDMRSLSQRPPIEKPNLLQGIREHEFLLKVQDELNRQGGDEQAQAEINKWIEAHNQKAPGAKPSAANTMEAKFKQARAAAEGKAKAVPADEAPTVAYRVRDAGDKGIMPKGHAQATTDLGQAKSYISGRGSAQNAPQEVVKVDLTKLKPSEYTLVPGPGGKPWVRFKGAVPESFIEKVGEHPEVPTDATMEDLLRRSIQRAERQRAAKAGDD